MIGGITKLAYLVARHAVRSYSRIQPYALQSSGRIQPHAPYFQKFHINRQGVSRKQYEQWRLQSIDPCNYQFRRHQIVRLAHDRYRNKSFCTSPIVCGIRSFFQALSLWHLLRKMGVPYDYIIGFRRWLRKFNYPWLSYSVPTALAVGVGDIFQQMLESSYQVQHISNGNGEKVQIVAKKSMFEDFDYARTRKLMLIAFFVLGPMLSKWNCMVTRRIGYTLANEFLVKKTALNILIFAPVATIVCLSLFDFDRIYASYPDVAPIWNSGFKQAFIDIMQFNLMTRVIMDFAICLLVASCLRAFVRRPYEILFFTYVSSVLFKHNIDNIKLRKFPPLPPPPPPPPPPHTNARKKCQRKSHQFQRPPSD